MSSAEHEFWMNGREEYQELAEQFERDIELKYPESVTSKRMCACLDYANWCGWAASAVTYYSYEGESIL